MRMSKQNSILYGLNDQEVLDEFVKRFECDGAILIYLDGNTEHGFSRSVNTHGQRWANELMTVAKNHLSLPGKHQEILDQEESAFSDMNQKCLNLTE